MHKLNLTNFNLYAIPVLASTLLLIIYFPGFMSFDSIRMLDESRSSVIGGIYPTMPVYLLRIFDFLSFGYGHTTLIFFQNFAIFFVIAIIFNSLNSNSMISASYALIIILYPVSLGCMLVLWKDVTVTAFILISTALIFKLHNLPESFKYKIYLVFSSIFCIIIVALLRFNSLTCSIVLAAFLLHALGKVKHKIIFFILIISSTLISNHVLNSYRFPDFTKLQKNTIIYAVMLNDIYGISRWSGHSLLPIKTKFSNHEFNELQYDDIKSNYSSLGYLQILSNIDRSKSNIKFTPENYQNSDIFDSWLTNIKSYPLAYLKTRWKIFCEIIGLTNHQTFEPTHFNKIDENKFNISFKERAITKIVLDYIYKTSFTFIGKPWIVLLLGFMTYFLSLKFGRSRPQCIMLSHLFFLLTWAYLLPFFVIAATGEVRYSFPSIIFSFFNIFLFISLKFKVQETRK